jgi:hypothetical protein
MLRRNGDEYTADRCTAGGPLSHDEFGENRMTQKLLTAMAIAASALLVSSPLFAHHAAALYDRDHPITLKGNVTEYLFTNPHVQIHFDVKDENGNVVNWDAESAPPQRLYRAGWNTKTLKPGDEITVTGAPFKDGRKQLSVQKLTTPSGKELHDGAE